MSTTRDTLIPSYGPSGRGLTSTTGEVVGRGPCPTEVSVTPSSRWVTSTSVGSSFGGSSRASSTGATDHSGSLGGLSPLSVLVVNQCPNRQGEQ